MTDFSALIKWYKQFGRALPWRQTANPYHIWLSEVILQQTRVEQGLPWFYTFVENFPEVCDLAEAPEDKVLKLWQGLGYYSRARNLKAAAVEICKNHQGKFPESPAELRKLKGIGPYTAAAIASFAFNYPAIALDGNLLRVASRYFLIQEAIDKTSTQKLIYQLLEDKLKGHQPADFNQALMDLGALICTPARPKCENCPLNEGCKARAENQTANLPFKRNKTKTKEIYIWYFIPRQNADILVRKRIEKGIWQNMYDFPSAESEQIMSLKEALLQLKPINQSNSLKIKHFPTTYTHVLSHRKLIVNFAVVENAGEITAPNTSWVNKTQFSNLAIPRLIEKFFDDYTSEIWDD